MREGKPEERWINCGRLLRAVGLRGELAAFWMSGSCPVAIGQDLFIEDADASHKALTVAALRRQGRSDIIRFEGIEDRHQALKLSGHELFRAESSLPVLPEGEYYCYQLLGMEVITDTGKKLGKIVRIFTAGEHDVYEVAASETKRGEEMLIPAIPDVILSVDVEQNVMRVRPLEGMLDSDKGAQI